MLTADHGHPRTAHRQFQIPHCPLMQGACTLLSLIATARYVLRMRVKFRACALRLLIAHARYVLRMRVKFRACALRLLIAHAWLGAPHADR